MTGRIARPKTFWKIYWVGDRDTETLAFHSYTPLKKQIYSILKGDYMLDNLDKLTKENVELMEDIRDEWVDRIMSLEFKEDDVIAFVEFIYEQAAFHRPEIIICDSPMAAQLAANEHADKSRITREIEGVTARIWEDLWSRMLRKYWNIFNNDPFAKVAISPDEQNQFPDVGRNRFWKARTIRDFVSALWSNVNSDIENIINTVKLPEYTQTQRKFHSDNGGLFLDINTVRPTTTKPDKATEGLCFYEIDYRKQMVNYDWAALYQFLVALDQMDTAPKFDRYLSGLMSGYYFMMPFDSVCIVCRPPVHVHLDDESGRLSSTKETAIAFKDGYGLNFVENIYFDEELFDRAYITGDMTGKDILAVENAEQKVVLIRTYGYEHILDDVDATVLDTFDGTSEITGKPVHYELFEFNMEVFGRGGRMFRVIKVEDHTTHKSVTLGVPVNHQTRTCLGAIAWTFEMTEEQYKPFIES